MESKETMAMAEGERVVCMMMIRRDFRELVAEVAELAAERTRTADERPGVSVGWKWLTGDRQLREYAGFGSPREFAAWREGTEKGNRLDYLMNGKSYIYRTDRVDEFLEREFAVQHVRIGGTRRKGGGR